MKKLNATIIAIVLASTLVATDAQAFQIFVKDALGSTMGLEVEASDTIDSVKAWVQDRVGYHWSDQYLYFNSNFLEVGRTLADYNVQKEATLDIQVITTLGAASFAALPASLSLPIRAADSTPGAGWMQVAYGSPVDLTGMGPCSILLYSYDALSAPGEAGGFDPAQTYTWTFLTATGGISGFDAANFVVDTTPFANAFTGSFTVVQNDGLAISYNAVPEPSTYALLALAALALACARLRKKTARQHRIQTDHRSEQCPSGWIVPVDSTR